MNPAPNPNRIPAALFLFALLAAPLAAQHVLLVEDDGKALQVCAAKETKPCVEKDGKLVEIESRRFDLREVPEYLPAFVSVRNVKVKSTYVELDGAQKINNNFLFDATLDSDYRLEDVFLVLYLETEQARKTIFLMEVGELEPGKAVPVSAAVPMGAPLGGGHYTLHLFSGGPEVLQSEIPFDKREAALDRMVAKRVENVHDAAPRLFMGPPPVYPPTLKKANRRGQAVIAIRIGANGAVYDPKVASATDPAFGEAALAAVRRWRFLPRVRDGLPVETLANVPFNFAPPEPVKGAP